MKLNEEQLRYIIDEHVENVLNEWFGSRLWNGAKNFAQSEFVRNVAKNFAQSSKFVWNGAKNFARSEFVQNVGNIISPGYGDRINSFAHGDWKNAKRRPNNDDLLKKYQQYCQKKGIDPKDEASRKQFLNDNK